MPTTDPKNGTLDIEIPVDINAIQKAMLRATVSKEVAQHVLWHFGDEHLGVQAGTFIERLMLTISAADTTNRAALAMAFPAHVAAYRAVACESWGLEFLRDFVRGA